MKLELSIFRFDAKSDYLPYYKKHFIKIKEQKTLLDIFKQINIDEPFGFEASNDFSLVINGLYTKLSITIEELINHFGKDLTIEPLSIRRAYKDLLIDEEDFKSRLELLKDFTKEEDKKEYLSNKIYFYASNTLNFQYNYIGDALLLLAHKLIEKEPKNKGAILEIISNEENSIESHTSLENRIYNFDKSIEKRIRQIKESLSLIKEIKEQNFCLDKNSNVKFFDYDKTLPIKHDFHDFNLAYYYGNKIDEETNNLLNKLCAKKITLENKDVDLNLETFHINPNLTIRIAASIMLEAFDGGADLLIVDSEEVFKLFDSNRESLSKVVGREVIIPILHKSELFNLAQGEHDKIRDSLKKHEIDPEII